MLVLSVKKIALLWLASLFTAFYAQAADFAARYAELKRPAVYSADVPTGRIYDTRVDKRGTRFHYALDVPKDYDPNRAYPLYVLLHGLVSRDKGKRRDTVDKYLEPMHSENSIAIYPMGWKDAMWWQTKQVDNINALISEVGSRYHVNPNRIYLLGVSDGGHGAYYLATHTPDRFAALVALIGSPYVLDPKNGASKPTFVTNLVNTPTLAVNGSRDPLYAASKLQPLADALQKSGSDFSLVTVDGADHTVSWFPEYQPRIRTFLEGHVRVPHPDRLYWEVDDKLSYPRCRWLVIDKVEKNKAPKFVSLVRRDNDIHVQSAHVKRFTLLISPDQFDLSRPLRVLTGDKILFNAKVTPSVAVLNKWNEKDKDPERLYGAEVVVQVR